MFKKGNKLLKVEKWSKPKNPKVYIPESESNLSKTNILLYKGAIQYLSASREVAYPAPIRFRL